MISDSPIKHNADHANEIHDVATFQDPAQVVATPVLELPESAAAAVVQAFTDIVTRGRGSLVACTADSQGVVRSQTFEEGDVFMIEPPFDGFFADRYIMDFYDVEQREICSRMHLHTGLRFVRMMTGPGTHIRVSSLSPFIVNHVDGVTPFRPREFEDSLPECPAGTHRVRYNLIVPPCTFVDMQIPRGVSHQFNAIGDLAVIDSVHPEESIEVLREHMSGYKMMAQTVFLADRLPHSATCTDLSQEAPDENAQP